MKKLIVIFCMVLIISSCGKTGIRDNYVELFCSDSYYLEFSICNDEGESIRSGFFAKRDGAYCMQLELSDKYVVDMLFVDNKAYFVDYDAKTYTVSEDDPFTYEYIDRISDLEIKSKDSDGDDYVITCKNGHENTVYLNYTDRILKSIDMPLMKGRDDLKNIELREISSSIPDDVSFEIPKEYKSVSGLVPAMD
ncbi:MAG: hypothetical protein E7578_08510 [Ruminococcaceae bacterium]|nr:hypothetical protein [Oscillospiraceae bacterium]